VASRKTSVSFPQSKEETPQSYAHVEGYPHNLSHHSLSEEATLASFVIYLLIYILTYSFYIYSHVYTLFGSLPPLLGRICSALSFSDFVEEKT
jgi:hypothetical protein